MSTTCPCGSGAPYDGCCGPLHDGTRQADTAEALMRSRYSAFALAAVDHLLASWDDSTRPAELTLPHDVVWTRLRVLDVVAGGTDDATGIVEFRAHFRRGGEPETLQERSHFVRDEHGRWRYLDADEPADT